MTKVLKIVLVLTVTSFVLLGFYFYFYIGISGGIKGLWYDITKPSFDPYSKNIVQKRDAVADKIITDFDFIDSHPALVKYGIHNSDNCTKTRYGFKNRISIYSPLYECIYSSSRFYGVTGEYESTLRDIISYIENHKKGLTFQSYNKEQIFKQKEWINDPNTTQKIIDEYKIRNPDKTVKNIYDVISFLEGQDSTSLYPHTPSEDKYSAKMDLIDWGVSPLNSGRGGIYNNNDIPDLREKYVMDIIEKHKFGLILTLSKTYYSK